MEEKVHLIHFIRDLLRKNILFGAVAIGLFGGIFALAYQFVLEFMLHTVWGAVHPQMAGRGWIIVLLTSVGGMLVGCTLKFIGKPGEIAAVVNNIHLEHGRLDIRQAPAMVANSLVSITSGGSAGPEAPLVQVIGSFASWLGDRLALPDEDVRVYTFCGMATALGALFGAPVGGALFALEIPHRQGLEYYEALLPSCIAALVGFLVFRGVMGWEAPMYQLHILTEFSYKALAIALALGAVGAVAGGIFAILFRGVEHVVHPIHRHTILLATLGGALIGLTAIYFPETLFWGELQIRDVLVQSGSPTHFFLLALVKMMTIGFTLHFGFRGGFIFPLFFIGAALGIGISMVVPGVPYEIAVLSMMAAVNVAVTKTPISTTVILATLTGTNMLPVLAIASFTSFVVASRVDVISTQGPRTRPGAHEPQMPSASAKMPTAHECSSLVL